MLCPVVSDCLLFEMGNEVASDWKELALGLSMSFQDLDKIEMEAHTPREQAWKMLRLWHSKKRKDFSVDGIHKHLLQIREQQQAKEQQSKWLCVHYFDYN